METVSSEVRGAGVIDRSDSPRGFLGTGWPLVALALLLLMLVRACVPAAPAVAPPPAFDPVAAVRQANDAALAALRALPAEPTAAEALAALNSAVINFASGSDTVPADAAELLASAASVIAALPAGTRIVITGHTDNIGDNMANQLLSERRAAAVRAALVAGSVPAEVLSVQGMGEREPIAGNETEAGRFRNRRIEFSAAP